MKEIIFFHKIFGKNNNNEYGKSQNFHKPIQQPKSPQIRLAIMLPPVAAPRYFFRGVSGGGARNLSQGQVKQ